MVRRPSWIAESGLEAFPEDREWSVGHSEGPEWSGDSPGWQGEVGRPFRWAGNGREAHPDGWKALLDSREWFGGPPGGPGVIGRLSRGPVVVGRQSRRAGSG